jgi:hypothetical protein
MHPLGSAEEDSGCGGGIVFYTGQADLEAIRRDWPEAKVLQKPAPLGALMQAVIEACVQIRSRSSEATPELNASF